MAVRTGHVPDRLDREHPGQVLAALQVPYFAVAAVIR
jgi:hypothetical protein